MLPKIEGMIVHFLKTVIRMLLAVASLLGVSPLLSAVAAQEIPKDKTFEVNNSSGVNLHDLQYSFSYRDISIGSGNFPSRLDLIREYRQFPFQPVYRTGGEVSAPFASHSSHNFLLTAQCFPCDMGSKITQRGETYIIDPPAEHIMTVKAFDGVHSFRAASAYWGTARTWVNRYNDGARLTDDGDHVTLITKSGDQITFSHTEPSGAGLGCGGACSVALYAIFASGETIVFSYDKLETSPSSTPVYFYPTLVQAAWSLSRLTSVVNSRGYGLSFDYVSRSLTDGTMQTRSLISQVSGFRTSCGGSVVNCNPAPLPQVSYRYSLVAANTSTGGNVYRLTYFKDVSSKTYYYEYNGPEFRLSRAYLANSSQIYSVENTYDPTIQYSEYGYTTGKVRSQKNALGDITSYSGGSVNQDNSPTTTTVTFPDGTQMVLYFNGNREFKYTLPYRVVTPLGRELKYTYDDSVRLTSVTDPLGGTVYYTLDDRGNVTKEMITPKTGSTEAPLSRYFGFPNCDTANFRYCNKPSYVTDAKGFRTDYSYDASSGFITIQLLQANSDNVRSIIRYNYGSFYPAPGVGSSSGLSLPSATLLISKDDCLTSGVFGTNVDFTYVCSAGDRSRTSYVYTPSSSSARSNYELEGIVKEADGKALRTCFRYDVVGNRITQTKPNALQSSCN